MSYKTSDKRICYCLKQVFVKHRLNRSIFRFLSTQRTTSNSVFYASGNWQEDEVGRRQGQNCHAFGLMAKHEILKFWPLRNNTEQSGESHLTFQRHIHPTNTDCKPTTIQA
jgi:hypothetical protein